MTKPEYFDGSKVIGKECRFVTYVPPQNFSDPDLHVIKEILHLEDGRKIPNLAYEWNYQQPFWILKKGQHNFEQYIDYIEEDKCNKYFSNRTQLAAAIGRTTGNPRFSGSIRMACESNRVFGADINSTACIKRDYQLANKHINPTEYSVAVFDTERDVVHGTNETIMATLSYGKRCLTVVKKDFIKGILEPEKKLRVLLKKYLGEIIEKREIEVEFMFVDQEIETYSKCFERAHVWMPDFVTMWNKKYDVGEFLKACERADVDPAQIVCDPSVPEELKFFKLTLGRPSRKTSRGLEMPVKNHAQWHTSKFPASFYFIDSMCAYKHTRAGKQEETSYKLDAILKKNGFGGKLRFEEADAYTDLAWHEFMQSNYPLEYIIYNIYDCVGLEMMEEKIKDLRVVVPQFSGTSDFEDFKSQPRRKCDELHWFLLEHGFVVGTTNKKLNGELDKKVLSREGWIITLANSLVDKYGLRIIRENPDIVTSLFAHVGDLDVSASYPNGECSFNISRRTTVRELSKILGITEDEFRMQNMGLSSGYVNALEYSISMHKAPKLPNLLDMFEKELAQGLVE